MAHRTKGTPARGRLRGPLARGNRAPISQRTCDRSGNRPQTNSPRSSSVPLRPPSPPCSSRYGHGRLGRTPARIVPPTWPPARRAPADLEHRRADRGAPGPGRGAPRPTPRDTRPRRRLSPEGPRDRRSGLPRGRGRPRPGARGSPETHRDDAGWRTWRSPATTSASALASASAPGAINRSPPLRRSPTPRSSSAATRPPSARWRMGEPEARAVGSYARVSYFRELQGDLRGALAAMQLAVSAGGDAGGSATCRPWSASSSRPRAVRRRRARLPRGPRTPTPPTPRAAGPGADRGEPRRVRPGDRPISRGRRAAALPEYVIALGEVEEAAGPGARRPRRLRAGRGPGRAAAGRRGQHRRRSGPVRGQPRHPRQGGRAGAQRLAAAPSVRSADAYSWALSAAGRAAALRLLGRGDAARVARSLVPVPRRDDRPAAGRGTR